MVTATQTKPSRYYCEAALRNWPYLGEPLVSASAELVFLLQLVERTGAKRTPALDAAVDAAKASLDLGETIDQGEAMNSVYWLFTELDAQAPYGYCLDRVNVTPTQERPKGYCFYSYRLESDWRIFLLGNLPTRSLHHVNDALVVRDICDALAIENACDAGDALAFITRNASTIEEAGALFAAELIADSGIDLQKWPHNHIDYCEAWQEIACDYHVPIRAGAFMWMIFRA